MRTGEINKRNSNNGKVDISQWVNHTFIRKKMESTK